jgi:hypothetical protein
MNWLSSHGATAKAELAIVNNLLDIWERHHGLPECVVAMLVEHFVGELRDAKAQLEKELARKN